MRIGTNGGSQKTASATCAGGINRTTRIAISRNFATRRKLNLFEATGRHSREELPLEKAAYYSVSDRATRQVKSIQAGFERTRASHRLTQQLEGAYPIAGERFVNFPKKRECKALIGNRLFDRSNGS